MIPNHRSDAGPREARVRRTWFDRIFQREEMNGDGRCGTYLVRWTLMRFWSGIGVYLHHFTGDDWSRDLHDHPKRFISIGLWGSYIEETPAAPDVIHDADVCGCGNAAAWCPFNPSATDVEPFTTWRLYRAPWVRTFPAEHIHRIRLVNGHPCWTLVIVLKTERAWGFWSLGRWIPWREYVASDTATRRKACP
jgi:hypothetical protein